LSIFICTNILSQPRDISCSNKLIRMDEALIFDNGTGYIKSGYLGENVPRANFSTVVGRPRVKELGMADTYVAEFAKAERDNLCFPIERGIIKNWEDMETVWYHNFYNELREDPSEHPVLLTESAQNTQKARQESAKIMFETFEVPALSFIDQTTCTLVGAELKTGLVVEFGHGLTQIVAICNGKKDKSNTHTYQLEELI